MGQFYDFKRFPKTAWSRSRKERVKRAEKEEKEFNESWKNNVELSKVRKFREQEKLNDLAKFGLSPPDVGEGIQFSQNIIDAEKELEKKLGKNWNEVKNKKVEEKVDNSDSTFSFKGVILGAGDRIELTEFESDFELSDEDKLGMKNLLSMLKKGKDIKKLAPLKIKTINLSAN